ncbi:hypothetical protein [Rhizobium sp. AAP43]|uniref:hypothetical protein n=1 Tax=Rhizobium sp. AAP43 TaxID=1523420 RepID=UPI0006B8B054|nr:hypothetical protein [Rhizobium sp. AAP43]KPF46081.1 hypothetical protein IP76_03930 [Rhizobium sp. AAP43]
MADPNAVPEVLSARSRLLHSSVEQHGEHPLWLRAARLIEQPNFSQVVFDYCRSMTGAQAHAWPSNKIFAQKFRYITCYTLVAMHAQYLSGIAPPPTMKSLQAAVPSSPRQVSELISGLRAGGYVRAVQNNRDLRTLRLQPSDLLIAEVARSPLAFLEAAGQLDGVSASSAQRLRQDTVTLARCLAAAQKAFVEADIYLAPFRIVSEFTDHDSGYLVLCAVIGASLASHAEDGAWDLPLTYQSLAMRFQVSRQHIGNLLKRAAERDLFLIRAGRVDTIDPDLVWEFQTWCAGQIALYASLAEQNLGNS